MCCSKIWNAKQNHKPRQNELDSDIYVFYQYFKCKTESKLLQNETGNFINLSVDRAIFLSEKRLVSQKTLLMSSYWTRATF